MGGQNSDIGNFDKYLKTDFTFLTLEKGWNGYDASKPRTNRPEQQHSTKHFAIMAWTKTMTESLQQKK